MSFSDMFDFEAFQLEEWWDKLKESPEQLITGVDPFSTELWNRIGVGGGDNEPWVNQLGGPMGGDSLGIGGGGIYDRAEAEGIDTSWSEGSHDIAEAVAMFYAGGALGDALGGATPAAGEAGSVGGGAGSSGTIGGGEVLADLSGLAGSEGTVIGGLEGLVGAGAPTTLGGEGAVILGGTGSAGGGALGGTSGASLGGGGGAASTGFDWKEFGQQALGGMGDMGGQQPQGPQWEDQYRARQAVAPLIQNTGGGQPSQQQLNNMMSLVLQQHRG